jgi:hypothetical protein
VSTFRRLRHFLDLSLDALDAARLRVLAQEPGVKRGIEMIGVADVREQRARIRRRQREPVEFAGDGAEAVILDGVPGTLGPIAQPVLVEVDALHVHAVNTERMEVDVALACPIPEFDAELERRLRGFHEGRFVEAQHAIEAENVGDRRFADADGADLVRFDQRDRDLPRVEHARERGGRHPACRTATGDDDPLQQSLHGFTSWNCAGSGSAL